MKIAVLGDTHFGLRNDSSIFHELYKKFYIDFINYLKENDIQHVVQLGDLFDRRKYVNFLSLEHAKRDFFIPLQQAGIRLFTLIGNHDIFYKNTLSVNSPELVLKDFDNIQIFTSPSKLKLGGMDFDMIPWICDDNELEIVEFIRNSSSEFCFGHFELSGFEMDRGNMCHDGWDATRLSRYELVMTGHFHHKSQKGNVLYVGSPGEATWADYDDPRGFHVFDTKTRELEFFRNRHTIYRKISYDDDSNFYGNMEEEDFAEYNNKYVKVIVVKKTSPFAFEAFIDGIIKAGPVDLTVVEDFAESEMCEEIEEVDQADDTITIIDKVIDSLEIDLNKQRLKSILREVYTEALVVES